MILGRTVHPPSACFDEISAAVESLRSPSLGTPFGVLPPVCFNAHRFPEAIPAGAIIYNLENVGVQIPPSLFPDHDLWDFSQRNVQRWNATYRRRPAIYVPVGFHPSMIRFSQSPTPFVDVVFLGALNPRRERILSALRDRGLNVVHLSPGSVFGQARDTVLTHAKLTINMLFYEDGLYPILRAAHAVANRLPMISEHAPELPAWAVSAGVVPYEGIIEAVLDHLAEASGEGLRMAADRSYAIFRDCPMRLPTPR